MCVSVWMIGVPVNCLHVGATLHRFLCSCHSLENTLDWGAVYSNPTSLRGVIRLLLLKSSNRRVGSDAC